jgi:hypothetical protein
MLGSSVVKPKDHRLALLLSERGLFPASQTALGIGMNADSPYSPPAIFILSFFVYDLGCLSPS